MNPIPGQTLMDESLRLVLQGYTFIQRGCRRHRSELFWTRLMFQKAICMSGRDCAELFYDTERFQRAGASPQRLQRTVLGHASIQSTDDGEHRWRKDAFLSLATPDRIADLVQTAKALARSARADWQVQHEIVLFKEAGLILFEAVCAWAGVPVDRTTRLRLSRDTRKVIDGAGGVGPRYWKGRMARRRVDRWLERLVVDARDARVPLRSGTALQLFATQRDSRGELLPPSTAAEELYNVLRPTMAVDRFITFAALALHQHPECRARIEAGDERYLEWFVHEVRRYYPFFPFAVARVRQDFEWRGFAFPQGTRVLLDLYGTDHDARLWPAPGEFKPERFRGWNGGAFEFIPQGGGDRREGHRCPGEEITVELMKMALLFLTREVTYDVPPQDLSVSLVRMPSLPRSGFVLRHVRPKEARPIPG